MVSLWLLLVWLGCVVIIYSFVLFRLTSGPCLLHLLFPSLEAWVGALNSG